MRKKTVGLLGWSAALVGCVTTTEVSRADYVNVLPAWVAEGSATLKVCPGKTNSARANEARPLADSGASPPNFAAQPVDLQLHPTPDGRPVAFDAVCGFDRVDRPRGALDGALPGAVVGGLCGAFLGYLDGDTPSDRGFGLSFRSAWDKAALGFTAGAVVGGLVGIIVGGAAGHTYQYVFKDRPPTPDDAAAGNRSPTGH